MILDLRESPSGGGSAFARFLLGRLNFEKADAAEDPFTFLYAAGKSFRDRAGEPLELYHAEEPLLRAFVDGWYEEAAECLRRTALAAEAILYSRIPMDLSVPGELKISWRFLEDHDPELYRQAVLAFQEKRPEALLINLAEGGPEQGLTLSPLGAEQAAAILHALYPGDTPAGRLDKVSPLWKAKRESLRQAFLEGDRGYAMRPIMEDLPPEAAMALLALATEGLPVRWVLMHPRDRRVHQYLIRVEDRWWNLAFVPACAAENALAGISRRMKRRGAPKETVTRVFIYKS